MIKHNLVNIFLILVLLALGTGCPPEDEPEFRLANIGESFQLKFDDVEDIPSEDLSIRFSKVVQDSRCPTGVICFTAGYVEVEITINKDGQNWGTYALAIGEGVDHSRIEVGPLSNTGDYSIELLSVDPYPDDPDRPISESEYEIELVVESL